jgi:hypothetical protein
LVEVSTWRTFYGLHFWPTFCCFYYKVILGFAAHKMIFRVFLMWNNINVLFHFSFLNFHLWEAHLFSHSLGVLLTLLFKGIYIIKFSLVIPLILVVRLWLFFGFLLLLIFWGFKRFFENFLWRLVHEMFRGFSCATWFLFTMMIC